MYSELVYLYTIMYVCVCVGVNSKENQIDILL